MRRYVLMYWMCYVIADGNKPSQNSSIVPSIIVNIAIIISFFLSS